MYDHVICHNTISGFVIECNIADRSIMMVIQMTQMQHPECHHNNTCRGQINTSSDGLIMLIVH